MPTIVPNAPIAKPSRPSSIDPAWLDGRVRIFKRGEDFNSRVEEFSRQFRRAARNAGSRGHCNIMDDDTVQAYVS